MRRIVRPIAFVASENEAGDDGGGIYCEWGQCVNIHNGTVVTNHAGGSGGSIACGMGMGEVLVNSTILWGNRAEYGTQLAHLYYGSRPGSMHPTVKYCCIEPGPNSVTRDYGMEDRESRVFETNHNITDDPILVLGSDGDCHLRSQAGRWDPNSANWILDDVTSPCIDAGDPDSPIGNEPSPNGGVINIGAYGGTAEASKSGSDAVITSD